MPIQIASQPKKWTSAYRTAEFVFESDLYPNNTGGDVNISILSIQEDDLGVFLIISSQFTTQDLSPGETILIQGTDLSTYIGSFRVTNCYISAGLLIAYIDTPYTGDETGGTVSRTYPDLKIIAQVFFSNGNTVDFELEPNEDNQFTLPIQEAAARQFIRVFDEVDPTADFDTPNPCVNSIAMAYDITAVEQFTTWLDGVPSVTLRTEGGTKAKNFRVVNCIHPYHKEEDGDVTFDWESDLAQTFVMSTAVTGRRLLTWSRHQDRRASLTDDFFVSFLAEPTVQLTALIVYITTYNSAGAAITVQASAPFVPTLAYTCNVGPRVLTIVNSSVAYYTVRVLDQAAQVLSEELRINVDLECGEVSRRIVWRNKLGGLDQYTMKGREVEASGVERTSIRRNYMPNRLRYGSWMERGVRADPTRGHVLTSELLPVATLRYLGEDCFESTDLALHIREGWWTPLVVVNSDSTPANSNNENGRFLLEYAYGVDNGSQRG